MESESRFAKKYFYQIFGVVTLASLVGYLLLARGRYVWYDETYTLTMMRHSFKEMWSITAADVHPPLYYFVLKLLTAPFGYSEISTKIVSIIPYMCIIIFGGLKFRRLFDEETALMFMVLFFVFPFGLGYSIEIRMYSMAAAFVFFNAIYAYECYKDSRLKNWVLYVVFGIAAAYTHYFALVSVGLIYAMLLVALIIRDKKKVGRWFIASVVTLLLYVPWLKEFLNQLIYKANNEYWIEDVGFSTVVGYVYSIFGGKGLTYFTQLAALAYLVVFICMICKKNKSDIILGICMLAVPVGTIAIGVLASVLVRPVFVIRYLVPAIPLLVAFMAVMLRKTGNQSLIVCLLTVMLVGGISNYKLELNEETATVPNALDAEFTAEHKDTDCYVMLADTTVTGGVLAYYAGDKPVYWRQSYGGWCPFTNVNPASEYDPDKYDNVILLLNQGEKPTEEWTDVYECEYVGEVNENTHISTVYSLKKKS